MAKEKKAAIGQERQKKYPTVWDLNAIYKGPKDPKINADLAQLEKDAILFEKKHKGKIGSYEKKKVRSILEESNVFYVKSYLVSVYAELLFSTDSNDSQISSLYQRVMFMQANIGNHFIFVNLELGQHPKLAEFAKNNYFAPYNVLLEDLLKLKKYQLSHAEEKVINIKSITANNGWVKLFESSFSRMKFQLKFKGKTQELDENSILKLLYSENRELRKAAADSFTPGLKKFLPEATQIYNMLLLDKMQEEKLRGIANPEETRHIHNGVSQKTVDALIDATKDNFKLVSKYYAIKGKLLGLEELKHYDRYAAVSLQSLAQNSKGLQVTEKKYSYDQAVRMVEKAYRAFDSEFADIYMDLVKKGHVDVYPRDGKRGGAFCAGMPKGYKPYVFLNHVDTARDVETLAHEMGHAIHFCLSEHLPFSVSIAPLTLAETASVFGEMIIFEDLLAQAQSREEKIAMLCGQIDGVMATIFRQMSMFMFERLVHGYVKENGEIPAEKLNEFWLKTQRQMHGKSISLDDDYGCWWSYIPHFMHTPFYVYAYAFGNLLVFSLYEKYKQGVPDFVKKYKEVLSYGGSKTPQEALAVFGFDLETKEFWQNGFNVFKSLIAMLEKLV